MDTRPDMPHERQMQRHQQSRAVRYRGVGWLLGVAAVIGVVALIALGLVLADMSNLSGQLDGARESLADLRKELSERRDELATGMAQCEVIRKDSADLTARRAAMASDMAKAEATIKDAEAKLRDAQAAADKTQKVAEALAASGAQLDAVRIDMAAESSRLTEARKSLAQLTKDIAESQALHDALIKNVAASNAAKSELEWRTQELAKQRGAEEDLRKQIEQEQRTLAQAEKDAAVARSAVKDAGAQQTTAENQLADTKSQISTANRDHAEAVRKRAEAQDELQRLQNQAGQARTESANLAQLQLDKTRLASELGAAQKQLDTVEASIVAGRLAVADLEARKQVLAQVETALIENTRRLGGLDAELKAAQLDERALAALRAERTALQKEVDDLRATRTQLTDGVNAAGAAQRLAASVEGAVQVITTAVEKLTKKLTELEKLAPKPPGESSTSGNGGRP